VVLIQRYLNGLMDPFVTLLEAHKLMFFMQEAGENLRLTYRKANYGPYAENLRHVLRSIEGHLVAGYSDGGDDPTKRLSLVPGAYEDADHFLAEQHDTRARFDRVARLVDGFETPYGLELLSTVYWVAKHESAQSQSDVQSKIYDWNDRKKRFTPEQIALALNVLSERGWLDRDLPIHRQAPPSATATASSPSQ
jgi:hypothetical protein